MGQEHICISVELLQGSASKAGPGHAALEASAVCPGKPFPGVSVLHLPHRTLSFPFQLPFWASGFQPSQPGGVLVDKLITSSFLAHVYLTTKPYAGRRMKTQPGRPLHSLRIAGSVACKATPSCTRSGTLEYAARLQSNTGSPQALPPH